MRAISDRNDQSVENARDARAHEIRTCPIGDGVEGSGIDGKCAHGHSWQAARWLAYEGDILSRRTFLAQGCANVNEASARGCQDRALADVTRGIRKAAKSRRLAMPSPQKQRAPCGARQAGTEESI